MPISQPVRETGLLVASATGPQLKLPGGGIWQIEPSRTVNRLIGERVTVEGARSGFNDIACQRIWKEGTARPRFEIGLVEKWTVSTLVASSLILVVLGYF
jgi:hypothetical protein